MYAISHSSMLTPAARPVFTTRPQAIVQPLQAVDEKSSGIWETGKFSFSDVIDAINPLQHIPIVSTIYQKLTGDKMGYAARVVGDTAFFGILGSIVSGLVSTLVNVVVDAVTGKDIAGHVMDAVTSKPAPIPQAAYTYHQSAHQIVNTVSAPQQPLLPDQPVIASMHDTSHRRAAIEQYKWDTFSDKSKLHSNFWG